MPFHLYLAREISHDDRAPEAYEQDMVVIPVALTMPVTGIPAIVTGNVQWVKFEFLTAITIYAIAMVFAVVVQRGWVHQMIHMTEHMPAPSPALAAGPGAAPAGPPP